MPKNIVICCDGTGNQFGNANSNVVNLYSVIEKEAGSQIAYYDPGLGTSKYSGIGFSFRAFRGKLLGLMSGIGIYENVYEAYLYLMENYEEGDRIFLFGFSRGAYTVRVLAGFISMLGLLEHGCQNLIPYAFEIYARRPVDFKTAAQFKSQFSRKCPIHFLGVWDTVSSVGYLWNLKTYPYTANNKEIGTVRHAASIHECRSFYTLNRVGTTATEEQDVKEVWFSGVHSDVGGSYPEEESGLAKVSLRWMLNEAAVAGLKVNVKAYNKNVLGRGTSKLVGPNPDALIHNSLTGAWRLFEFIPRYRRIYEENRREWYLPRGRLRTMPEGCLVHESVFQRKYDLEPLSPNVPRNRLVEKTTEVIAGGE